MQVEEAIRHRRSIRRYLPDPVPATVLREILALASLAPSVSNRQMWRYIVLTDDSLKNMLARLVERHIDEMALWPEFVGKEQRLRAWKENSLHFAQAPAVIFIVNLGYRAPIDAMLAEHGMRQWDIDELLAHPDLQSISGMIAYLVLLAEERELGTCWMTDILIARKDLEAALELQSGEHLSAVITIGTPAEYPPPKNRKPIDDLIEWR